MARIEFLLGELFTNLRRNGLLTVAAVITTMWCLVVFGVFNLVNLNLQRVLRELTSQAQISVYLPADIQDAERQRFEQAIRAVPGVLDCKFVSGAERFEQLKKNLDSTVLSALDLEAAKYFPPKFSVIPTDSGHIEAVAKALERIAGKDNVAYAAKVVEGLNNLLRQAQWIGWVALVLFALATCAIISNAIRLTIYARRREIRIMQLVGATDWFIRVPFVLEGLVHGVCGGVLAVLVTSSLYGYLARASATLVPFLKLEQPRSLLGPYSLLLIALGALIGMGSSALSLRRFMREA
jgi:cell division transport system permease protein